jgi:toxin ParE1/3/4
VTLILSPEAVADIERLRAFLTDKDTNFAQRVIAAFDHAFGSLEVFPDRGRPSDIPGAREFIVPFGGSSYVLRYVHLPKANEIVVLRIWHGREARK